MARSRTFQLIPFEKETEEQLVVTGIISRNGRCLTLSYQFSGEIGSLIFPDQVAEPSRCDELWQRTCCECFFRVVGHSGYYELNVSPNGNWNVYHFTDYRRGMREETAVSELDCQTSKENGTFTLHCALELDGLVESGDEIEIGVSCVLTHTNGTTSHWALSYPGQKPDFHHPETFMLRL